MPIPKSSSTPGSVCCRYEPVWVRWTNCFAMSKSARKSWWGFVPRQPPSSLELCWWPLAGRTSFIGERTSPLPSWRPLYGSCRTTRSSSGVLCGSCSRKVCIEKTTVLKPLECAARRSIWRGRSNRMSVPKCTILPLNLAFAWARSRSPERSQRESWKSGSPKRVARTSGLDGPCWSWPKPTF